LQRRQLPLDPETFIMGDHDVLALAIKQLKLSPPILEDYPAELFPYLRRKIWRSTLGEVEESFTRDS
jgi:hypothetical protein